MDAQVGPVIQERFDLRLSPMGLSRRVMSDFQCPLATAGAGRGVRESALLVEVVILKGWMKSLAISSSVGIVWAKAERSSVNRGST